MGFREPMTVSEHDAGARALQKELSSSWLHPLEACMQQLPGAIYGSFQQIRGPNIEPK